MNKLSQSQGGHNDSYFQGAVASMQKAGTWSSMKKGKAVPEGFPEETIPRLGFEGWVGDV